MINAIRSGDAITILLHAFSILVMIFVVFPVHESSHALAAKLLGDDTAERQGRISLNPFVHLDLIGTIGIALLGIGWAKPVPVDPRRCTKVRSQKTAMAITSAAGPMANIVSSLVFMIIMKIILVSVEMTQTAYYIILALQIIIDIDLYNGVFNLLPIPPFDGSRVLLAFLPNKYYFSIMKYERYILYVVLILLWSGLLSIPFGFIADAIYAFLDLITKFIC